ncbi:MAG: ABC transporter substrate-binding protein, partial [Dehalococcoidia bacterium]|nr:ABC transporter substrate-binding protein [Dehalococcoidia bacterium]
GKKIAVSAIKTGAEALVSYFLKQGGLSINDVELVPLGYPDMLVAYSNKAIDGAIQLEPLVTTAVENGLAVRWPAGAPSVIYGGEYQSAGLVISEQFAKDVDAVRRFMVGYVKGLRDYNDAFGKGKDKNAVIGMITKYTSDKDPALYSKMVLPYLNPDGKIHVPSMQMDLDYLKTMGYYTGNVTVLSMMDNQFVDYALQQLGPYR